MTQRVTIFNLNSHPLEETFKGERMRIEPNSYWLDHNGQPKVFDIFEANDFKGQYRPAPMDEGSGRLLNDQRFFKMLKIEPVGDVKAKVIEAPSFKCMAPSCKHVAANAPALKAHTEEAHASIDTLIMPEQDEQIEMTKKKKAHGKQ